MNEHITTTTDIPEYPSENYFNAYFSYIGYPHNTEASLTIHRWCAISVMAANLGRQFMLPYGILGNIVPNHYIQIIGEPASRKSTAIKIASRLLKQSGYKNFAPDTTTRNQFLVDLHDATWGAEDDSCNTGESGEFSLNKSLFGSDNPKETAELLDVAEMYIANDEFVDFIGRNNTEFVSLLGTFWDYDDVFVQRLKNSKAVYINRPTLNIIAGNTHEGFNTAFPPEMLGQGFFSRLLLIYAEETNRKVASPKNATQEDTKKVLDYIAKAKLSCVGNATMTAEANAIRERLYMETKPMEDSRFKKYAGRRQTHLLKLALVCAAARVSRVIHSCDIIMANTLLTYAEYMMPKAMGEFGKGRNSHVIHKILSAINAAELPVPLKDIYKLVHTDVDKLTVVNDLINELQATSKIQFIAGLGFLPVHTSKTVIDTDLVKPSWLFAEEVKLS